MLIRAFHPGRFTASWKIMYQSARRRKARKKNNHHVCRRQKWSKTPNNIAFEGGTAAQSESDLQTCRSDFGSEKCVTSFGQPPGVFLTQPETKFKVVPADPLHNPPTGAFNNRTCSTSKTPSARPTRPLPHLSFGCPWTGPARPGVGSFGGWIR